ncbi:MAG: MBL fold metallo-hydrolase [Bacteroidetes bacterium]|nr:MBL fold metallo-hydrolase [Bacteroidota bacterium]
MGNKDKTTLTRAKLTVNQYVESKESDGVLLWWLGQAGFLIQYAGITLVIDAYLSDELSVKYAGKKFPHKRMMEPPIPMENFKKIDYVLCSHSHSDHMDPGLLKIVAKNNPECRFIMPEAVRSIGIDRGAPENRILSIDAGTKIALSQDVSLVGVPAAHEELQQDKDGHHLFLGFMLTFGDIVIYHPGDSIPYEGLDANLEPCPIDLALMPINGRSEELSSHGIVGNFNFSEALHVMRSHNIPFMIPHHFEMFDFNTVDRGEVTGLIASAEMQESIFPAEIGVRYKLSRNIE